MNNVLSSVYRRRKLFYLLDRPLLLRRFSAESDPLTVIKPDFEESVAGEFLEHLRNIPQHDWESCEHLDSLISSYSSSSPPPPRVFSQITRRLGSYSLALSFFDYLNEKSPSLSWLWTPKEKVLSKNLSAGRFVCRPPVSRFLELADPQVLIVQKESDKEHQKNKDYKV